MAIRAPVLPAETATSASPFLTASMASHMEDFQRPCRNAWLGLASILTAMSVWTKRETALRRRPARDQRLDHGAVAEQDEFGIGVPVERDIGSGHDHRCAVVAPHGVKRDADLIGHGGTLKTGTAAGAGNTVLRER